MQKVVASLRKRYKPWLASFSLVELLTVIAIIAILAGLVLGAASGILNKSRRSRAQAEIAGMGSALENYKVDNGQYPQDATLAVTPPTAYSAYSFSSYQPGATNLFYALAGQTALANTAVANSATRSYYLFKANQVGSPASTTYVQDPWGNAYGYCTGSGSAIPYSGTNMFDLWSTAFTSGNASDTNTWIVNWNM